jgi:hypothetical protein
LQCKKQKTQQLFALKNHNIFLPFIYLFKQTAIGRLGFRIGLNFWGQKMKNKNEITEVAIIFLQNI